MKIALINAPTPFLINEKVFPNIGILRVATQLQREGHQIKVYDFAGRKVEDINKVSNDFDYYGFSSTTPQLPYVVKMNKLLKQQNPNAKTIIGGAHASSLYQLRERGVKDINIFVGDIG